VGRAKVLGQVLSLRGISSNQNAQRSLMFIKVEDFMAQTAIAISK
jgi:hypothetical protein